MSVKVLLNESIMCMSVCSAGSVVSDSMTLSMRFFQNPEYCNVLPFPIQRVLARAGCVCNQIFHLLSHRGSFLYFKVYNVGFTVMSFCRNTTQYKGLGCEDHILSGGRESPTTQSPLRFSPMPPCNRGLSSKLIGIINYSSSGNILSTYFYDSFYLSSVISSQNKVHIFRVSVLSVKTVHLQPFYFSGSKRLYKTVQMIGVCLFNSYAVFWKTPHLIISFAQDHQFCCAYCAMSKIISYILSTLQFHFFGPNFFASGLCLQKIYYSKILLIKGISFPQKHNFT